jgi:hypothetical protein
MLIELICGGIISSLLIPTRIVLAYKMKCSHSLSLNYILNKKASNNIIQEFVDLD